MKCKRCGCTEDAPCMTAVERPDRSHESVPCAWAVPNLCTNCLTPDEQMILVEHGVRRQLEDDLDSVEQLRARARRQMFTVLLPARVTNTHPHVAFREEEMQRYVDEAWQLAEFAAAKLFPEPAAEPLVQLAETDLPF